MAELTDMLRRLMSETIIQRQPGPETEVRARIGSPNVMVDATMPDRGTPMADRFMAGPSLGDVLNLLGPGRGAAMPRAAMPRAPVSSADAAIRSIDEALKYAPPGNTPVNPNMRTDEVLSLISEALGNGRLPTTRTGMDTLISSGSKFGLKPRPPEY